MDRNYWLYLSIIILVVCSAFFSATEIAYASANKHRLKKAVETGSRRAKWAQAISDEYDKALCTILLANNLVNISATSIATIIALSVFENSGMAYATGIMTFIILVFGEIAPKQIGKQRADEFIFVAAPTLRFLMIITKPIVVVVMKIMDAISSLWGGKSDVSLMTEDELVTIIETIEEEGVIDEDRSDLLQSVIEFSEILAEEIITHRMDVLAVNIDDKLEEIIKVADNSPYSRIPVYEGSIDNIIGVLSLNHLYKALIEGGDASIQALLMSVCYVHKSKKLPIVLNEMQKRKIHMAVVIDDYGGTLGILTMEDILEEIVGEIWDETDEIRNDFVDLGENKYEVDGNLSVSDLMENVGVDSREFEDEFVSVGGWVVDMLGDFPKKGDNFKYENIEITVTEMDDLRVVKVQAQVFPSKGE